MIWPFSFSTTKQSRLSQTIASLISFWWTATDSVGINCSTSARQLKTTASWSKSSSLNEATDLGSCWSLNSCSWLKRWSSSLRGFPAKCRKCCRFCRTRPRDRNRCWNRPKPNSSNWSKRSKSSSLAIIYAYPASPCTQFCSRYGRTGRRPNIGCKV